MNLAYSLNHEVTFEKIVNDIGKLCSKLSQEELNGTVLVISLQKILDPASSSEPITITYNDPEGG